MLPSKLKGRQGKVLNKELTHPSTGPILLYNQPL